MYREILWISRKKIHLKKLWSDRFKAKTILNSVHVPEEGISNNILKPADQKNVNTKKYLLASAIKKIDYYTMLASFQKNGYDKKNQRFLRDNH